MVIGINIGRKDNPISIKNRHPHLVFNIGIGTLIGSLFILPMLFGILYISISDNPQDLFPNVIIFIVEIVLISSFMLLIKMCSKMTKKRGTFTNPHKYIYCIAFILSLIGQIQEIRVNSPNTFLQLLQIAIMAEISISFVYIMIAGLMENNNSKNAKEYDKWKEYKNFCLTVTAVVNMAWFFRYFLINSDLIYGFNSILTEAILAGVIDFRLQTLFGALRQLGKEIIGGMPSDSLPEQSSLLRN
jgi:hypothetical protein